jgi:hypothetical protein
MCTLLIAFFHKNSTHNTQPPAHAPPPPPPTHTHTHTHTHTPCADPVCCIAPLHCIPTSLVRPTIQLHSRAEPDQRVEYRRAQDARGREGAGELQRCARIPILTNSDPCPATRVDRSTVSLAGCIACALYAIIASDLGSVFLFNMSQDKF